MAKFRFRLSPLRKLREAHRDQMQAKLAEALQAEQRLQQQLDHMRREISSSQNSHRALLQDARTDVHQLLESQRYQFILRAEESTMKGQTQLLATEVERRRRAMVRSAAFGRS